MHHVKLRVAEELVILKRHTIMESTLLIGLTRPLQRIVARSAAPDDDPKRNCTPAYGFSAPSVVSFVSVMSINRVIRIAPIFVFP